MCRTAVEDMIDFPVSDHWRDYYFEKGLTPHHSPIYTRRPERQLASMLTAAISDLQNAVIEATQSLSQAATPPQARPTSTTPPPYQGERRRGYLTLPSMDVPPQDGG